MLGQIIHIAFLCIVLGSASIPLSFQVNNSPWVVWVGNGLGSLISAIVVIMIGDRITSEPFRKKISKRRFGRKVVKVFDEGTENKKMAKARNFINKHGIRFFGLFCPIFPGVSLSTATVYVLGLDRKTFKRWMFGGVLFVSWIYVFGYWWVFVR